MNSLLVLPEELRGDEARIEDSRALYISSFHDLKPNLSVKAILWGGGVGEARVLEISKKRVRLKVNFSDSAPQRTKVDLIAAIPRPQTVKKVLQLAAMCGVANLYLVQTERVVKSYLQSKSLRQERVMEELIKGMEQVCDPIPPEVHVVASLQELLESCLNDQLNNQSSFVLADPNAEFSLKELNLKFGRETNVVLFVGPESGFVPTEIAALQSYGFKRINLGERIFRVEVALSFLLGQIQALRK